MRIAIVGLGRMGSNMARRLARAGHEVVIYNRSSDKTKALSAEESNTVAAFSPEDAVALLNAPRIVWLMLPAGEATAEHVRLFGDILEPGDLLVNGANDYYGDDKRYADDLKQRGIRFLDAGVSGGIWGLQEGYCTMVGGDRDAFVHLEPILRDLAPPEGYIYCGPTGAGHFMKMVHNGIEYAMMAAYGEGFELIERSEYGTIDLSALSHVWNRGSVIRSWLLELAESAFRDDPDLSTISGWVDDSGEGRWTVRQAIETAVPAQVITLALMQRFRSRQQDPFADRVLAALRQKFGGHGVKPAADGTPGTQPHNPRPRGI